jgi:hypothetical protein
MKAAAVPAKAEGAASSRWRRQQNKEASTLTADGAQPFYERWTVIPGVPMMGIRTGCWPHCCCSLYFIVPCFIATAKKCPPPSFFLLVFDLLYI